MAKYVVFRFLFSNADISELFLRGCRRVSVGGPLTVEQWPTQVLFAVLSNFDAHYVNFVGTFFLSSKMIAG